MAKRGASLLLSHLKSPCTGSGGSVAAGKALEVTGRPALLGLAVAPCVLRPFLFICRTGGLLLHLVDTQLPKRLRSGIVGAGSGCWRRGILRWSLTYFSVTELARFLEKEKSLFCAVHAHVRRSMPQLLKKIKYHLYLACLNIIGSL